MSNRSAALLDGFLFGGCFGSAEMFGALRMISTRQRAI
jgi:hypothetical protein